MSRYSRKWAAVFLVCDVTDLENETTLSFYNHDDYEKFKANPEEKWM
jgi:Uncharacterized conserved protein (DUF2340)